MPACLHCGKEYKSKGGLTRHIKDKHTANPLEPVVVPTETFVEPTAKKRVYTCDECNDFWAAIGRGGFMPVNCHSCGCPIYFLNRAQAQQYRDGTLDPEDVHFKR